MVKCFLSPF